MLQNGVLQRKLATIPLLVTMQPFLYQLLTARTMLVHLQSLSLRQLEVDISIVFEKENRYVHVDIIVLQENNTVNTHKSAAIHENNM